MIPTSAFDVLAEERPWYSLLINVNKHVPLHPNDISKHKPINDSIEERTFWMLYSLLLDQQSRVVIICTGFAVNLVMARIDYFVEHVYYVLDL